MKKLTYTKPHNLGVLMDELQAAIPELRPQNGEAVFHLSGDGTAIELWVPDEVTKAAVDAVVNAHTNPPPPDTTRPDFGNDAADLANYPAVRQWVIDSRAYVTNGSPTAAETVQQVKRNTRAILAIVKRMV